MDPLKEEWRTLVKEALHLLSDGDKTKELFFTEPEEDAAGSCCPAEKRLEQAQEEKKDQAKQIPEVALLVDEPLEMHRNLARAIASKGSSCLVLEVSKLSRHHKWAALLQSSRLKFLLCEKKAIAASPEVAPYFSQGEKKLDYLAGVVSLALHSPEEYERKRELKAALWNAVCMLLSS